MTVKSKHYYKIYVLFGIICIKTNKQTNWIEKVKKIQPKLP